MSTKKRKPLGSAIEEFVFGTKEAVPAPRATELVSPPPTPTASLIITNNGNTTNTANTVRFIANGNTTAARSLCTTPRTHSLKGA